MCRRTFSFWLFATTRKPIIVADREFSEDWCWTGKEKGEVERADGRENSKRNIFS